VKKRSNVFGSKDIQRLGEAASSYLMEIVGMAEQVSVRAHRDSGGGFPARSGSGEGSRSSNNDDGSVSGPTPALAMHRDPIEILANRLMKALVQCEIEARTAVVAARAIRGLDHETAQKLNEAESPKGVDCLVCGEFVPGIGEHRVKAGRCPTCFQYRNRHDGVDRVIVVEID